MKLLGKDKVISRAVAKRQLTWFKKDKYSMVYGQNNKKEMI